MILDLHKFIERERPCWTELQARLDALDAEPLWRLDLPGVCRLHYLYERASAALSQIHTFSSEPEVRLYLEQLVARAYGAIHAAGRPRRRIAPLNWFFRTFPRTFRRHAGAFGLSLAITLAGTLFGVLAVAFDPEAKEVIVPFGHLVQTPSQRVRHEEQAGGRRIEGHEAPFAALLMTHNIHVAFTVLALGITWGIGSITLLFYNGVILGAVAVDYVMDSQTQFLLAWLLPHGVIEIPAILIAGQAALVLAAAMIGKGQSLPLKLRLRAAGGDLVTLVLGVAVMLVWAGIVEAFFSQYHQPVLPYWLKILFGCVELAVLCAFLGWCGRGRSANEAVEE